MRVPASALGAAMAAVPAGRLRRAEARLGYMMVAPAMLLLALLIAYPFLMSPYMSLTDQHVGTPGRFVGLANFGDLLRDDVFRQTALNSILYTVVAVAPRRSWGSSWRCSSTRSPGGAGSSGP